MHSIDGIFADENILPVGKRLVEFPKVGTVLYPGHPDVPALPLGAQDVEIFDEIGEQRRNLLFITRDRRIRFRHEERDRLIKAKVRAVIISGKSDMTQDAIYGLIIKHWDEIAAINASQSGPWIYGLSQQGLRKYRLSRGGAE